MGALVNVISEGVHIQSHGGDPTRVWLDLDATGRGPGTWSGVIRTIIVSLGSPSGMMEVTQRDEVGMIHVISSGMDHDSWHTCRFGSNPE